MTITAAQIREACALLRWSSPSLIRSAKVSYEIARKARDDIGIASVSSMDLQSIRNALEKAGVEFTADPPGACLRTSLTIRHSRSDHAR